MTFVNESCFATVPSCTVSVFPSGIHPVMTFALQKLPTATAQCSKHFASQNGLLSKFCYAKPPIQNFASQSGFATAFIFAVH